MCREFLLLLPYRKKQHIVCVSIPRLHPGAATVCWWKNRMAGIVVPFAARSRHHGLWLFIIHYHLSSGAYVRWGYSAIGF